MRLYLAAAYSRKIQMRLVESRISAEVPNVVVTSRWLGEETDTYYPPDPAGRARMDVEDIDASDFIARFSDDLSYATVPSRLATGARMWEQGYAHAKGKTVIVVGGYQCVFDHLPGVIHLRNLDALVDWLRSATNATEEKERCVSAGCTKKRIPSLHLCIDHLCKSGIKF